MAGVGSVKRRVLAAFNLVLDHLARQRIAVHAERIGRPGEAAVDFAEHANDEPLLEFADGIVELHAFVDHFLDEPLEPIRNHSSSRPVSRRKASMYLSRVLLTTSSGRLGTGGCLFQRIRSR